MWNLNVLRDKMRNITYLPKSIRLKQLVVKEKKKLMVMHHIITVMTIITIGKWRNNLVLNNLQRNSDTYFMVCEVYLDVP